MEKGSNGQNQSLRRGVCRTDKRREPSVSHFNETKAVSHQIPGEKTRKQKQLLKQLRSTQSSLAISTPFNSIPPIYTTKTARSHESASCVQRDESLDACQFPAETIYQTPNYSPDELYHAFMPEELPLAAQQDQSIIPVSFQSIHQPARSCLTPWHDIVKLGEKHIP